ncbi:MAG: hypothetical protein GY820_30710 [Gammaproteobacteria bacterium]|nr:hypothetical protein [Gammaproteobacteria bacterium]
MEIPERMLGSRSDDDDKKNIRSILHSLEGVFFEIVTKDYKLWKVVLMDRFIGGAVGIEKSKCDENGRGLSQEYLWIDYEDVVDFIQDNHSVVLGCVGKLV